MSTTIELYYNIFALESEAFLGTVRVLTHLHNRPDTETPSARARRIACEILGADGAPGGIKAVMSTQDVFKMYGLNKRGNEI